MSAQSKYREVFLSVRWLLQEHDPLNLMATYGGDRFDNEIYGYEATTIIESLGSSHSPEKVEEILGSLAAKGKREVSDDALKEAVPKIAEAISAL